MHFYPIDTQLQLQFPINLIKSHITCEVPRNASDTWYVLSRHEAAVCVAAAETCL